MMQRCTEKCKNCIHAWKILTDNGLSLQCILTAYKYMECKTGKKYHRVKR